MKSNLTPFDMTRGNTNPGSLFSTFFKERENDLVGCGPIQSLATATEIFREDEPAELVYLIERGIVKLGQIGLDGKEIIVGLRSRYWLLGSPAVFLGVPYTFAATTLTPCRLRPITAKCFFHLLKTSEIFSWETYRQLSQSIHSGLNTIVEVSHMSAEGRLVNFLCQLVAEICPEKTQTRNSFHVPLKHHELADIVGVSSEHLCRLVKKIEREGVIISTKGMLTIQDVSKLSPAS